MSKYIKLDDLKWHSPDESITEPLIEFYVTESDIADLPTIEVNEDAISRANLIESFLADNECKREEAKACMCSLDSMLELIEDAPSVIPQPKEGEWILHGEPPIYVRECSECGAKYHYAKEWGEANYCSNCGSKMKGASDDTSNMFRTDLRV